MFLGAFLIELRILGLEKDETTEASLKSKPPKVSHLLCQNHDQTTKFPGRIIMSSNFFLTPEEARKLIHDAL